MEKQELKQGMGIDPSKLPTDTCECGSRLFVPRYVIKTIPGTLVGEAGRKLPPQPVEIFVCEKCGKIAPSYEDFYNKLTDGETLSIDNNSGLIL